MSLKKSISFFLIVLMVFVAACSNKNNTDNAVDSSAPAGTAAEVKEGDGGKSNKMKEISFWHSFTQPDRMAKLEKFAKEFEDQNPGVKIKMEAYPWATFHTKWTTGLSTKALPDVSSASVEEAILMARSGVLSPMEDVIDTLGRDRFIETPLKLLSHDGKTIALPYYMHARVLWYRKDILEEKGIKPPETWDELMQAAEKAADPSKQFYGMAIPMAKNDSNGTLYLYMVAKSRGAHYLDKDGKVNLTDPKMIESIQYLADMYKKVSPKGSVNYTIKEMADLWYQGKVAFDFNSGFNITGVINTTPELADKISALPPPKASVDSQDMGWMAEYISLVRWNHTKYPEETKKFVEFLYDKARYIEFLHVVPGGMMPILKDVAESEEFLGHPIIKKFSKEVAYIQEGIEKGSPIALENGATPAANVIKNQGMIEEMLQRIVLENVPVEQAAKETQDKLNKAIEALK